MTKYYAGIGSRSTPPWHLSEMVHIAKVLGTKGYVLRSGGAEGADKAFEAGCDWVCGAKEIYRPSDANDAAIKLLKEVIVELNAKHGESIPMPQAMKQYVRALLARNMMQILGKNLATPVDFVVCYTEGGHMTGGTRYAICLAQMRNIPVYNLCRITTEEMLKNVVD